MKLKIGFTGTRHGMSHIQRIALQYLIQGNVQCFRHGDCVGADADAHEIAVHCSIPKIIIHPPMNPKFRAFCHRDYKDISKDSSIILLPEDDYLARNKQIVLGSDLLIAAPTALSEELRSGTWHTIRYARKLGVPVIILDPYSDETQYQLGNTYA